jgi:hypothetical protein
LQKVSIDVMRVDRRVQRSLDAKRATSIANDFRPEGFGYIVVSRREDGLYIVDGQHRIAALKQMGEGRLSTVLRLLGVGPGNEVLCEVFTGLELSDEAALFRVRNNFKQIKVHERFRVRVIEGDPVAVFLYKSLERHGWTVMNGPSKVRGVYNAVSALEWVYDGAGIRTSTSHPMAVDNTLATITGAWGHDSQGVRAEIVRGIGLFVVQYGENIEYTKLITELAQLEGGAAGLVGKARNLNTFRGGGVSSAMAEILVSLHNKGRRVHVLPEWRRRRPTKASPKETAN